MDKYWVLDATLMPKNPPAFCPYDAEDGSIVLGLTVVTDRCPGELVGVFHSGGQSAAEKFCADNPDWHKQYRRLEAPDGD